MIDWFKRMAAVSALAFLAACGGSDDDPPPGTLAQEATEAGFSALVAAADKAGLVPALSDASATLTVFAPTDAAFTSLATTLGFASAEAMVTALDGPTLAKILQYHVLPARKSAADLVAGGGSEATLYTFDGAAATLALNTTAGVKLTDEVLTEASVTTADVPASNGVIHVIDKVLVPPGVLNVVQMAQLNPAFSTLVGAVVDADLAGTLSDATAEYTVFAPTNAAFEAIASTVESLTPEQIADVLVYHVLDSQVLAADIPFGTPVATVLGQTITINAGTPPTITDSTDSPAGIVATDVRASNGVIHVIDKVLIPTL
ncbi:fasciclin domain-containing protein [Piscinibacter sp.]|uniref:fasciclin domain-containing protein n=1 Tax=Piscinibacter sp. TaxID=1903157 RepID=UPI002583051D|nr:fasciclin domain-containing protein [Piscinibacter sp.]